ncbi:MAG: hypothetical protein CMB47_00845 [Euryarchaeota archaeon]|nr:hypothetical protein [Euryarchaeota archaeon]|tara:strand:+ start:5988 stop:6287 length:300 start_codon:yes stop_codon:yes gene_type:complete
METLIRRFGNLENIDSKVLEEEIVFLAKNLEILRITDKISNDAFLDAGMIQGGLSIISNLLSQGLKTQDVKGQLKRLEDKSIVLCSTYPELDQLIESMR